MGGLMATRDRSRSVRGTLIPASYGEAARRIGSKGWKSLGARGTALSHTPRFDGTKPEIGLMYHNTAVVIYRADGSFVLRSGGWHTVTTKQRINAALRDTPFAVIQRDFQWLVEDRRDRSAVPFYDTSAVQAG